ncbi:hypothetical protein C8R44DRAFT_769163 [Mycena epipterygia]|nr:hypothetical protein C8R44DRAFT_769163 [Mycena epipterygia]
MPPAPRSLAIFYSTISAIGLSLLGLYIYMFHILARPSKPSWIIVLGLISTVLFTISTAGLAFRSWRMHRAQITAPVSYMFPVVSVT